MSSYLDKKEGIFTPGLRFSFTNISAEEFRSKWSGVEIFVGPNEAIEISDITPIPGSGMGECLAIKMTGELVDRIMLGIAKMDEIEKNQPYYRSPHGGALGVPASRKPWEDKILVKLEADEDSPATISLRNQMRAQLMADMERKEGVSEEQGAPEFINVPHGTYETAPVEKKSAKTKKI